MVVVMGGAFRLFVFDVAAAVVAQRILETLAGGMSAEADIMSHADPLQRLVFLVRIGPAASGSP
jgi:hypothetical protein